MNSIALPVAELKPALVGLGKVLNKQSSLPVLSTIKVERTTDGWITLTVTDLDTFATVRLEQPTNGTPEVLLVPYDALAKTVKSCGKDEQILVERLDDTTVSIRHAIGHQFAEQKIETGKPEEFPLIPRIKGEAIPLPEALRLSLHQAIDCSSTDETRYVLNGAYLDVSDEKYHHVVGTDGRHLYSSNSFSVALQKSLILRSHRFLKWKEFNQDGEWQLKTARLNYAQAADIQISTRRWRFITREIDGNYPNWRQVIPRGDEMKIHFDLQAEAIEQVLQTIQRMPSHDSVNASIGIEVEGGKVRLLGKSQTAEYWTKVEVPAIDVIGGPLITFLNREILTKALKFGLAAVDLIDAMSPLVFSSGGRRMIVMPVRAEVPPPSAPSTAGSEPTEPSSDEHGPAQENQQPIATAHTADATHILDSSMKDEPAATGSTDHSTTPPSQKGAKLDEALELIDSLKDFLQDGLTGLKDLGSKLKLLQREQRTTEREFQSVRTTLRSLQNVKL